MAGIGGGNPLPFQIGGGPSDSDKVNNALKQLVGRGNSAEDETIEAEWRRARARALAASMDDERAIWNGFPDTATDLIEMYEDILGITPQGNISDEERRQDITDKWVSAVDASTEKLEAELQNIDALFSITEHDRDSEVETIPGRAFEDYDPTDASACAPAFGGGRKATIFPNYSTAYRCFVEYDIASSAITGEQIRRVNRVNTILNDILPAWVDYQVASSDVTGFLLDISLLDLGRFNP